MPYLVRLLCLSLTSFFLVHAALGLLLALVAEPTMRLAPSMRAREAARLILTLRFVPAGGAFVGVAAICVPSYLWLEPKSNVEQVGWACALSAVLGFLILAIPLARCGAAVAGSMRFLRACRRSADRVELPGEAEHGWVIPDTARPMLALAGAVHPRLVISSELLQVLSADQLDVAVRHERAHRVSRDNLKRLALLAAPDLIPFVNPWRALERGWVRFAEWSADDAAVNGDSLRSLSLAEALITVARAGTAPHPSPLVASLAGCGEDLAVRVGRLLYPAPARPTQGAWPHWTPLAFSVTLCGLAAFAMGPAVLSAVHDFLEHLIA